MSKRVGILAVGLVAGLVAMGCGGGGDDDPVYQQPIAEVPGTPEPLICGDQLDLAINYASGAGAYPGSVPVLWDGTPFYVDVAAALPRAHELLNAVADEALRIRDALGYDVILPGQVVDLPDTTYQALEHAPPDFLPIRGRIYIRCCLTEGAGPGVLGLSYPWLRQILLGDHGLQVLVHELYHLLGFTHPLEGGVEMSSGLLLSTRFYDPNEITRSEQSDWDNLACMYD